eukprot:9248937-Ditylum_brightwellii.AAC.1
MAMLPLLTGKISITAEAMILSFLIPVIPKIPGDPTYESIYKVYLLQNESSIQSTLGVGGHGLLGITMTPAAYTQETSYQFNPPVNPPLNL